MKTNKEILWKPIENYPDYIISSNGQVKRQTPANNKHKKLKFLKPTYSSNHKNKNPHPKITLYKNGKPNTMSLSRLILFVFSGNPPIGKDQCNHIDGNRKNNSIENLEWVSGKENVQHALNTGLRKKQARGEKCGNSKLKNSEVKKIKRMLSTKKYLLNEIAVKFGVKRCAIWDIKHNKTWNHINV